MRRLIASSALCVALGCASPTEHYVVKKPPAPKSGNSPVQVTTRSGSLREPGPEPPTQFEEPSTPTFSEDEPPARSARRFSSEIPQGNRGMTRRSSENHAGDNVAGERPTMAGWMKGLRQKKAETATPAQNQKPSQASHQSSTDSSTPEIMDQSTSIDPRRVYRGPKPPAPTNTTGQGSRFSESGVPQTNTDFRGRADSAF